MRTGRLGDTVGLQIVANVVRIFEGPGLGALLDEKVEGIVHAHVCDEIDLDGKLSHRLGENVARQPVAVGVLLDVDEVIGRRHPKRMGHHAGPAVRGRLQPDDLRAKADGLVVAVTGQVINAGEDGHGVLVSDFHANRTSLDRFARRPPAWRAGDRQPMRAAGPGESGQNGSIRPGMAKADPVAGQRAGVGQKMSKKRETALSPGALTWMSAVTPAHFRRETPLATPRNHGARSNRRSLVLSAPNAVPRQSR